MDVFGYYTEADFKMASISVWYTLRLFPRTNGVWVEWESKRNTTIAKSMYKTLSVKSPTN